MNPTVVWTSFALSLIVLGCGDIIKAPNPFKRGRHDDRPTYTDRNQQSCPNLRGVYRGACPDGAEETVVLDQMQCDTFTLDSGLVFSTDREQVVSRQGSDFTTKAEWYNERRGLTLNAERLGEEQGGLAYDVREGGHLMLTKRTGQAAAICQLSRQ